MGRRYTKRQGVDANQARSIMGDVQKSSQVMLKLEDVPKPLPGLVLGFQHVLVAFSAMVGVPLTLASALKLPVETTSILVSGVMVSCGICTLIQTLGLGFIGGRLPIVQGATFKFIPPMVTAFKLGGWPFLFGATVLGGLFEFILSFFVGRLKKLFSPFLTGMVLTVIGISLMPIGIKNFLAIGNQQLQGKPVTYFLGFATIAVVILLNAYGKGLIKAASIVIGIVIGYVLSALVGALDASPVGQAAWLGMIRPFALGFPVWPGIGVLVAICIAYLVSFVETVGDTISISTICETEPTEKRLRGSLAIDGLSGPISSIFNAIPMTSFTQNIGLVKLTGVASRFVVAIGGVILILLGLIPKLAALISIMPVPVLGAGLVLTFGMIASEGVRRLSGTLESPRNQTVFALAVTSCLAIWIAPPTAFDALPAFLKPFLADSMVTGLLATFILDLVVPKDEIAKRLIREDKTMAA